MVGNIIVAMIPMFTGEGMFGEFKLHHVETAGIWVENQEANDSLMGALNLAALPKTPVFFVPFDKVTLISSNVRGPALSEKAFGVK